MSRNRSGDRQAATSDVQQHFPAALSGGLGKQFATLRPYALVLIAVSTLAILAWSGGVLLQQPYSGLDWSYNSGVVQTVDAGSPAAGLFRPGERITAIDGTAVYGARNLPGFRAGDTVTFTVIENGGESWRRLQLAPAPPSVLFRRLSVFPVAFSFWLLGTLVLAFGPAGGLVTLFFLFCQAFASALGLGAVSASGPLWSGWAFNFLLWWVAPLALHTHLLLAGWPSLRPRARLMLCLYALALVLSLFDLWRLWQPVHGPLQAVKLLWVGLFLLLSAAVLVWMSRREGPLPSRRKTGIAALSASLAFLPLVLFSLVPGALLGRPLLSYDFTLLALPALPLGYAYAIGRGRLMRIDRYVNRGIAYALAAIVAAAVYAIVYVGLASDEEWMVSPVAFGAITLLIVSVPLVYKGVQRAVNRVFYGRWYDDRAAMRQVSRSVAGARGDGGSIGVALCRALLRVLQLEYVTVLLDDGALIVARPGAAANRRRWPSQRAKAILSGVAEQAGETIGRGAELRALLSLSSGERKELLGKRPQLWLLLGAGERPQGLLVLGPRRGAGELAPRDLEILEVVAQQAEAALENEYLLSEVRRTSAQLRRLHRQVVQAREEERKRVARDLHDHTIQALVGLNYRLAHVRRRADAAAADRLIVLQQEVRDILREVRRVCVALRPPALDALGLVPALESHVAQFEAQAPFHIRFDATDLNGLEVPDDVSLVVYRFVQEALRNVQKHAAAGEVVVRLEMMAEETLALTVEDDGVGFRPPQTLSVLVQEQHFGLVGLEEQVEGVGGTMEVCSAPDAGCRLKATVPVG